MMTMKYNAMILVTSILMISMHVTATYTPLPMQSTSAMQETGSTHSALVRDAFAPKVKYNFIPMHSTSPMATNNDELDPMFNGPRRTPIANDDEGWTDRPDQGGTELSPVGEPWILLLFAAIAAGAVAYNRRREIVAENTQK